MATRKHITPSKRKASRTARATTRKTKKRKTTSRSRPAVALARPARAGEFERQLRLIRAQPADVEVTAPKIRLDLTPAGILKRLEEVTVESHRAQRITSGERDEVVAAIGKLRTARTRSRGRVGNALTTQLASMRRTRSRA